MALKEQPEDEVVEELTINYLDIIEQYHDLSKQVASLIKNGLFEFTLGRRDDNEDAITRFHVPTHLEIEPLYKIKVDDRGQLTLLKHSSSKAGSKETEDTVDSSASATLRKRKGKASTDDEDTKKKPTPKQEEEQDEPQTEENKEALLKKQDPVYWFGTAVRPHVQTAQTHFQTCLKLFTQMANLKLELAAIERKLNPT